MYRYKKEAASNAQKIQKFVILDSDFSVDGGELTSTQKLKRNVVVEKWGKTIDTMY
jgi:long-chain-fatty-acid--CoA ligase ACSBG